MKNKYRIIEINRVDWDSFLVEKLFKVKKIKKFLFIKIKEITEEERRSVNMDWDEYERRNRHEEEAEFDKIWQAKNFIKRLKEIENKKQKIIYFK